MTRTTDKNKEPTTQAEDADLPDLSKFDMGADFDQSDGLTVTNRHPKWYYFVAIDSEEDRPDNLRNTLAKQYEVCTKETCPIAGEGTKMVLCRIPLEVWYSRRQAKVERRLNARKPKPGERNRSRTIADIPKGVQVHTNRPEHLGE
jgi:hypothetical protein